MNGQGASTLGPVDPDCSRLDERVVVSILPFDVFCSHKFIFEKMMSSSTEAVIQVFHADKG